MQFVTTKKVKLTQYELFTILIGLYAKKRKSWMPLLLLFFFLIIAQSRTSNLQIFLLVFIILYPAVVFIQHWKFARSKENKLFLLERYYDIYEDKIIGYLEDGTENVVRAEHFIKFVNLSDYYILYISQNQFIFIAKHSFQNKNDRDWFENHLLQQIKQRKR